MKNKSSINELHDAVHKASMWLKAIRDYPNSNNPADDERTKLEKNIYAHLEPLWDLCRQHPDYFEPTHETHPHIIDADGDIIPYDTEVERNKRIASYQTAIEQFCRVNKVSKAAFAKAYGCGATYLSRILSGEKAANHDKFVGAFHRLGFMPAADKDWNWTFEKLNSIL